MKNKGKSSKAKPTQVMKRLVHNLNPYNFPADELVSYLNFGPVEGLLEEVQKFAAGTASPAELSVPVRGAVEEIAMTEWGRERGRLRMVIIRQIDILGAERHAVEDFYKEVGDSVYERRRLCEQFLSTHETFNSFFYRLLESHPTMAPALVAKGSVSRQTNARCWLAVGGGWYADPEEVRLVTTWTLRTQLKGVALSRACEFVVLPMTERSFGRPTGLDNKSGLVGFIPKMAFERGVSQSKDVT